eukprot:jgi/Chlat1/9188/Chrsp97S08459
MAAPVVAAGLQTTTAAVAVLTAPRLGDGRPRVSQPQRAAGGRRRRRPAASVVRCRATAGDDDDSKPSSSSSAAAAVASAPQDGEVGQVEVKVRYDASMNRWVKDDRYAPLDGDRRYVRPSVGEPYVVWPVVYTELVARDLKSVAPAEALELTSSEGWVLLDVSEAEDYAQRRARGSVNVPLFQPVEGRTFLHNVKRFVMAAAFAMTATERNPNFVKQVQERFPKDSKIIVACALGGTLDTIIRTRPDKKLYADPDRAFGRESRSLKGAFELFQAGYKNVAHLKGGLNQWSHEQLPMDFD